MNREETQVTARQRRDALQQAHAIRRANLELKRQQLAARHSTERKALADMQSASSAAVVRDRAAKHPKGVLAFLARVTGFDALTAFRHTGRTGEGIAEQRLQTAALVRRHRREMQNFRHQERGLASLDKRERRSLETGCAAKLCGNSPARTAPASGLNSPPPLPVRPKSGKAMAGKKEN